jgi:hypothetical protein
MTGYLEESALDDAITDAVRTDAPDAVIIGWAVCVAYRLPHADHLDATAHAYFAPSGQPKYATIGLLGGVSDWLRGIGDDEAGAP